MNLIFCITVRINEYHNSSISCQNSKKDILQGFTFHVNIKLYFLRNIIIIVCL